MGWQEKAEEELKTSRQPTWQESAEKELTVSPREEPSELEATVRGAVQGLPWIGPLTDEIGGGAQAVWDTLTGDEKKSFMDLYRQHRGEIRQGNKEAQEAHPYYYGGGQLGGAVLAAPFTGGASIANLALQGAAHGFGGSDQDLTTGDPEAYLDTAKNAAIGGTLGGTIGLVSNKLLNSGKTAEKLAKNATGATGSQASKFKPGSGRELLDRGLVRAFDNPSDVAKRVSSAYDDAGLKIGDAINALDEQGAKFSYERVINDIQGRINKLRESAGNEGIIKKLESAIDEIIDRGQSETTLKLGEASKRAFQDQVNWASPKIDRNAIAKVANAFKRETERAATELDPSLAGNFMDQKKLYSLLAPIKEASKRRAMTLNQSPVGGFLDVTTGVGGAVAGGIPGAVVAPALRRLTANRFASTSAVILDKLSKANANKYIKPLMDAAQRGETSVAATHFILQQTDPQYHAIMNQGDDDEDQRSSD